MLQIRRWVCDQLEDRLYLSRELRILARPVPQGGNKGIYAGVLLNTNLVGKAELRAAVNVPVRVAQRVATRGP